MGNQGSVALLVSLTPVSKGHTGQTENGNVAFLLSIYESRMRRRYNQVYLTTMRRPDDDQMFRSLRYIPLYFTLTETMDAGALGPCRGSRESSTTAVTAVRGRGIHEVGLGLSRFPQRAQQSLALRLWAFRVSCLSQALPCFSLKTLIKPHSSTKAVLFPDLQFACIVTVSGGSVSRPHVRPEPRNARPCRISQALVSHRRRCETCIALTCSSPAATTPIHPESVPSSVDGWCCKVLVCHPSFYHSVRDFRPVKATSL
jgi:hypothetical protein